MLVNKRYAGNCPNSMRKGHGICLSGVRFPFLRIRPESISFIDNQRESSRLIHDDRISRNFFAQKLCGLPFYFILCVPDLYPLMNLLPQVFLFWQSLKSGIQSSSIHPRTALLHT